MPAIVVIKTEYCGKVLSAAKTNVAKTIPLQPIPEIILTIARAVLLLIKVSVIPEPAENNKTNNEAKNEEKCEVMWNVYQAKMLIK